MLVVGAALMTETLVRLESQPLGFRMDGVTVASVEIPKERWNDAQSRRLIYDRLLDKLKTTPGVESAAHQQCLTAGQADSKNRFSIEGQPSPSEDADSESWHVSPSLPVIFETLAFL